ncbi:hypothetical protein O3P69_020369 [Scylla paramamosain]
MNIMEDLSVRSQLLSAASTRSAADWLSAAHHCQLQQTTPASHHCLQSCSNHQEMAGIYIILLLGCLGTCMGTGVAHGTENEGEADLFSSDLIHWITPGHLFKLSCNMTNDDSTNFTLDWFRDDEKLESNDHIKIITANSSLIINDPTKDDSGIYRCQTRAGIPKDNPLVKNFTVIYFTIRKMTKSIVVTDQEELSLECPVDGKPFPKIVWRKDSVSLLEMKANDSRINFATNENEVPNAKLIISKVDPNDRGNYTCNVTTPFGSYEVFTYVRVKDIYAALWPFLGILVEVLLLGIIIFIFEKRRAKAEFEESDTDQGNDQ